MEDIINVSLIINQISHHNESTLVNIKLTGGYLFNITKMYL